MNKFRIIIFFLAINLDLGLALDNAPEQMELFEQAQADLKAGNIDEALTKFEDVLKIDPTFAPAQVGLAHVYIRKGDMEKTQNYLKQAIDADPENQEFRAEFTNLNELNNLMSQGGRSMKNGEFEKAYDTFKIASNKFPYFSEAIFSMGLVKFREKDYLVSVDHFKHVLTINPKHETARAAITNVAKKFFNEGNSAYKRGNLEGALEGYNKVLEIDQGFYQAHYQIGVINSKMGDKEAAIISYRMALSDNPEFYKGWFALGLAKSSINDSEGALEALENAVNINPGYDKAYVAMADIYLKNDNPEEAKRVLNLAIQVNSIYPKA
ncbi:MAG: tetratricopeptide repeat protein, partial [Candidatus Neomarinimicrobiota bacterium]